MAYGTDGLSASDVALLSGRNSDGFADGNGAWLIIIFLFFALAGFGNRGFGGLGGASGAADNYVLATDFATIERKLDSVNSGICDSTFALNNTVTNGFAGVQQTLCQGFNGVNTSILNTAFQTQRGLDGINYNMAINTSALQQAMCVNTRDIIDNQNANYRALHDEIVANRIEDKNAQIAAQQNEINALRLAASQAKQNEYLTNQLRPCPIPAYITCNPYASVNSCGCSL